MTSPLILNALTDQAPTSGSLLWWGAVVSVLGVLGAGLVHILAAATKFIRFLTRIEDTLNTLAGSVQKLTSSDETRNRSISEMAAVLGNVSSVNGKRYEELNKKVGGHGAELNNHHDRLVVLERRKLR